MELGFSSRPERTVRFVLFIFQLTYDLPNYRKVMLVEKGMLNQVLLKHSNSY